MKNFFDIAAKIYDRLGDEESRLLYKQMLWFSATGSDEDFRRCRGRMLGEAFFPELIDFIRLQNTPKIIFGAGYWGTWLHAAFPEAKWECFVDNKPQEKDNLPLPVYSPRQFVNQYPTAKVVIAVVGHTEEIIGQLKGFGVDDKDIFSLGDRLKRLETELLERQYFDLPVLKHDSREVFIDAGCFDGTTTKNFIKWANGNYQQVFAFEVNTNLYEKCVHALAGAKNCKVYNKGLWNRDEMLTFYESPHDREYYATLTEHVGFQNYHSGEMDWAEKEVCVAPLDDMLHGVRPTFIKMDIEGSEYNAISGARHLIRSHKPKLAISVYHKKEDILEIPQLVSEIRDDYCFYIRNYTFNWPETVLYAV